MRLCSCAQLLPGILGIPNHQRISALNRFRGDDDLLHRKVGGNSEHDLGHDIFHHSPEASGADLAIHRLLSNDLQCGRLDLQLHMIQFQQLLILLGQSVLGFHQNPDQILLLQTMKRGDNRQSAYQFRDNTEFQQIMGLNLAQQCAHIPLAFTLDSRVKTDGALVGALFDDLIQTVKSAAADEEDVAGIYLDHLLLGMLSATLRGNTGHSAFQDLQQSLLNTLAGYVAGDGGILALTGDLIHLIDVDDAVLRQFHIKSAA